MRCDEDAPTPLPPYERPMPVAKVARLLDLPIWKLRRAAKAGLFPSYWFGNSRRLLKPAEVLEYISSTRQGGNQ